jgi:hypothetical protein
MDEDSPKSPDRYRRAPADERQYPLVLPISQKLPNLTPHIPSLRSSKCLNPANWFRLAARAMSAVNPGSGIVDKCEVGAGKI